MPEKLARIIESASKRIDLHIERHRLTQQVSLPDHIRAVRRDRVARIGHRRLIYLDTNAWKCLADHQQGKPGLTPAMIEFAEAMVHARSSNNFIFPMGVTSFLELDSMTDQGTQNSLLSFVDDLSQGCCIAPFSERTEEEILRLISGDFTEENDASQFLCSPVELLGLPAVSFSGRAAPIIDELTLSKALFDTFAELPFSLQLELGYSAQGPRWNNSYGISEANQGKQDYQELIVNLKVGIFVELKGAIEAWNISVGGGLSAQEITELAGRALVHWVKQPTSRAFSFLRITSALHGLMRYDSQRRFKSGDFMDFMVAGTALPVAEALFTDKKLAALLKDSHIGLDQFTDCAVVSGFENMAAYLTKEL
ncbi:MULTISPECIES: hypothetical protein [unclassified Pseudomonas]|uniref:hypothetical protein n=1 Tax=unclassified Pseudomonas TaxID=196821 RepID=UPI00128E6AFE|nr:MULTISPECIES: hypothetical protein [unclassified Pseudomonas]MPQ69531.1 hypothetical protein [Pseudomonas sp. MWU12-2323]